MGEDKQAQAEFYAEQLQPELEADLIKLSPAEQRLYALRMATNPPRPLRECATMLGKGLTTLEKSWKNVKAKLGRDPLIEWKQKGVIGTGGADDFERLRNVSPDTMIKLLDMRIEAMARGITKEKIAAASLKELTGGIRESVNARQLLKGEPTQILQVNQRENLRRLFPLAVKELHRRGLTLEMGAGGMKVVQQLDVTPEPAAE